jgi:hypothetical protein
MGGGSPHLPQVRRTYGKVKGDFVATTSYVSILAIVVLLLISGLALAQTATPSSLVAGNVQPLNVKTGLWQIAKTITWIGLPPQYSSVIKNGQTIKYTSCVRAEHLTSNPWTNGSGEKCIWTVLNSTGTDMEVRGKSCTMGKNYGMNAEAHGTIHIIDSEDGTGTFAVTLTGSGQTMNGHASYTGKWIGASCPANMN